MRTQVGGGKRAVVGASSLGAAVLVVVAGLGCEDLTVQVLRPAASASASAATLCGPPAVVVGAGQLGDECKDAKACCGGACLVAEDGKKRCARVSTCASYCELCALGDECCSGRCEDDGEGTLRCFTGACRAQGEICGAEPECCNEAGPVKCLEDPAGLHTKRCRLDSSGPPCKGDAVPCGKAAECCGGYCVGGGKAETTCAASCVADGSACTTMADCCSLGATCALVGTTTVCGSVVP